MATARFALAWPTTCLSSSATISRGVSAWASDAGTSRRGIDMSEFFDDQLAVRVDADVGGDGHRVLDDGSRVERAVLDEGARRGKGVRSARSNPHHAVVGLDEVAGAGEEIHRARIGDEQHRLETPQRTIGAPVARQLDGRSLEVAAMLL